MSTSEKSYYDNRWSGEAKGLAPPNAERIERVVERVLRAIRANPHPAIIDIGCGNGWILDRLAREVGPSARLFGVEPSRVGATTARLKVPQATIWEGELGTVNLPLQFDVAILSEVIEHVVDQASFVGTLSRALKDGAVLVMTTPNGRFRESYFDHGCTPQPVENWLDKHRIKILMAHDFHIQYYTTFDLDFYYDCSNPVLGGRLNALSRIRGGWRLRNAMVDGPLAKMGGFGLYQLVVLTKKSHSKASNA